MKLLTKETDYAVRAMMHMARETNRYVSSREISRDEQIPLQFLRRILQKLIRSRLVTSREGISGGVRLRARPGDIRLARIIRVFQGDIELSECMFRKGICANRRRCVLRKRIKEIERVVTQEFESISIAGLLNDGEERR